MGRYHKKSTLEIQKENSFFDIIVANPPFSLENWGRDYAETDPYEDSTMDSSKRYW